MKVNFTHRGQLHTGEIRFGFYGDGNTAVELLFHDDECNGMLTPYAKLSVNVGGVFPNNMFVAKTYSENEGLLDGFIAAGLFTEVDEVGVGFSVCPVLEISPELFEEVAMALEVFPHPMDE